MLAAPIALIHLTTISLFVALVENFGRNLTASLSLNRKEVTANDIRKVAN